MSVRMTAQRRAIFDAMEALREAGRHPTADDVYRTVRRKLPRISLGTVYRNLEVLSGLGRIGKIESCGCRRSYDGDPGPHYHVRCTRCGCVGDVDVGRAGLDPEKLGARFGLGAGAKRGKALGAKSGFEVTGFEIEFQGLCPCCRKRGGKSGPPSARGRRGIKSGPPSARDRRGGKARRR